MRPLPAGNPILDGIGLTDPHIVIHEDRAYLFGTHDFSPDNTGFVMRDWWVWSSPDLVHWRLESTLRPQATFLRASSQDCWATFGVFRNNRWYWYFSAGPTEIGVVTAETAAGPWHDPLGKPLIARGLTPTEQRDPDILIDDGEAFMIFGTFDYYIVRLGADMISLAEAPRPVVLDRRFGPYGEGKTDDKPSLHKRNGIYYLSWSSFYATASSVYGPYRYRGSVIDEALVSPEFRGVPDLRSDRHGNFFTWHNQWFYAFNDKGREGRGDFFRDSCLSYVHFREDGTMEPIRLDRIGVGQYDASSGPVDARDYFSAGETFLCFPQVHNLNENATLSLRITAGSLQATGLEVREGGVEGTLLGVVVVSFAGHEGSHLVVEVKLKNPGGILDLCFVCQKGINRALRLESWSQIKE